MSWTKATDNLTSQSNMQYIVYQSTTNNIPSISGAEANGTALGAYATDINSKAVTGLTPNTTYYFMVITKDASGNKTAYTMLSVAALPLPPTLSTRSDAYAVVNVAWTYQITASNGSLPLVFSLPTAPAGATINSSTGLISFTPGGVAVDHSFSVLVTDAIGRTGTQNFTLHVDTAKVCVWTGAGDTSFSTAGNWMFCNGGVPGLLDDVQIDGSAPRQPLVSTSVALHSFAGTVAGAGGTLTIAPGVTVSIAGGVSSDVTVQGATPTCSTCVFYAYYLGAVRNLSITKGVTLTLGKGIKISLTGSKDLVVSGHLVVNTGSSNPAEWPVIDCDLGGSGGTCGGILVSGTATDQSSVYIDGLNMVASSKFDQGLHFSFYSRIKKLRNVNFSIGAINRYATMWGYISFYTCSTVQVDDGNWSGLNFPQGTRNTGNGANFAATAAILLGCNGLTPLTISGTGRAYGLEVDPYNQITWTNGSSSTCTWTGAVDSTWNTPGNWNNCTNGRSNYPDQLDAVVIPGTANQPVISGNFAMLGTGAGTGGGTITVSANSTLYVNDTAASTFASSITFAGESAGCTTCLVQMRGQVRIGDGVSFTLNPNIRIAMAAWSSIAVGESYGFSNRSANFIVNGGPTPANYPLISTESTAGWKGILVDGKTGTNSTVSIDGLVLDNVNVYQPNFYYDYGSGLILVDRFAVSKLDHLSVIAAAAPDNLSGTAVHLANCTNSSIVTTWNDLTIANDPSPGYGVFMSDASCSSISPITINGQGTGYGSAFANDPNGRFTWQ